MNLGNNSASTSYSVFTIAASTDVHGTISPLGSVLVGQGSNRSFAISTSVGYHINDVMVDGVSQGAIASYTFNNVTSNHAILASTMINTYSITATAGTGGAISPPGTSSKVYGSDISFTVTPNAGFHISGVMVDGTPVGVPMPSPL